MTQRNRPPVPVLPATPPANPTGTTPREPWDLTIVSGAVRTNLRLVRDPNSRQPMFTEGSAPPITDSLNTSAVSQSSGGDRVDIDYATLPPDQGKTAVVIDVSGGAGSNLYKKGRYAFGDSVETEGTGGIVLRGPKVVELPYDAGITPDGDIVTHCTHGGTSWVAGGTQVYYVDADDWLLKEPATQPSGTHTITCIFSWQGIVLVAYDNAEAYQYSDDDGDTWQAATAGGQIYAKFFADYHQIHVGVNPAKPVLLMSADPNLVFSTEDPTDSNNWDAGSLVGQGGTNNPDHNTSLTVAPNGALYVGKEQNLFRLDAALDATTQAGASVSGDVALIMGPLPADTGRGLENFAWPAKTASDMWFVAKDYSVRRLGPDGNVDKKNYGPGAMAPGVEEMQAAIHGITSDGDQRIFVSLAGDDGFIMKGLFGEDGQWQWHGSYCKSGYFNNHIWTESFPLSTNRKDLYLFMAQGGTPYTVKAVRIPRQNPFYDPDATFVDESTIRFGKDYAGQAQVTKVFSRSAPNTYNLASPTPTCTISYRVLETAAFTTLAAFNQSPVPSSDLMDTYAPIGVTGTGLELQATLSATDDTAKVALVSIEYMVFRRPIRKAVITCTVVVDNDGSSREGARQQRSWKKLRKELLAARDAVQPPILIDRLGGDVTWTVDLRGFQRRWLLDDNGNAATMVCDLVMQELDTILAPANYVLMSEDPPELVVHIHTEESFAGDGIEDTFTLLHSPGTEPIVFVDADYQMPDVQYTRVGAVITFIAPPGASATVWASYEYPG